MIEIFIFILGLCAGSFLNVLIHRLPRGESIVRPGSRCPNCARPVRWFDNVPVLSFILLRGKCRLCTKKISLRYPLIETAAGILWWLTWRWSPSVPFFMVQAVFLSLLLVASFSDWETGLIPDSISIGGMAAGLAFSFLYPQFHGMSLSWMGLLRSTLGLLAGGGLIYLIGTLGNFIFRKELETRGLDQSMGGGDVKLMAMAGSFLGWEKIVLSFFVAPLLCLPFALYVRWIKKEATVPYGPFLSLACAINFYSGNLILKYLIGA